MQSIKACWGLRWHVSPENLIHFRLVLMALWCSAPHRFVTSITTPQDAHKRLAVQVYLGSNTLEFSARSAIRR